MKHRSARFLTTGLIIATILSSACTRKRKETSQAQAPDKPVELTPINAGKSATPLLEISAMVRDDGLLLGVKNIPAGSTLECKIGETKVEPCHDGALLSRPPAGDHEIDVTARSGTSVLAADKVKITVLPSNSTTTVDDATLASMPLALVIDDSTFVNGMPIKRSAQFTAKFRFVRAPDCSVTVRCAYESEQSAMWPVCDTPSTKVIPKGLMAAGPQHLSVQASCPDKVGPKLTMFWYGVPDNYEALMLQGLKDTNKRMIFTLIRSEDCPTSQLKFECAGAAASAAFAACEKGNVLDNPPTGSRVRATCGEKTGPTLAVE